MKWKAARNISKVYFLHKRGVSIEDIEWIVGISEETVVKYLKELELHKQYNPDKYDDIISGKFIKNDINYDYYVTGGSAYHA